MKFSELNLHPTVAAALSKRGYENATPVQSAVLKPEAAGRDLLVSSQTGSGKTIAFGAVLAEALLAPDAARSGARANPLALVIVPTRELAIQVREELGWLLRDSKLRLASFTGGTPVSGDLRTLQRGLDVAIGTPGRLVDLLKRQRLDLAEVRVVVLDEADEMLDLGFREDLQTILEGAPPQRRTLLLSATIPSEIQALARRFQRDALRIDARKDGDKATAGAHGDITYVAHLIAGADRLAVVVNVLRVAGGGRAIVFCTTREAVSRLHAALLQRGFSATAISGERAQAERDRALEQVRRGEAQVLVATNVAARGLHLPDVDLIVHADLPLNAESLTHRSGRTGRAGRKGTAVVIASLSERRKAERLLMSAHVPVVWTAPPSPDSITAAARERLAEELVNEPAGETRTTDDEAAAELVARLEQTLPAPELARRLLLRELARLPAGERIHPVPVPGPERRDRFAPEREGDGDGRGSRRPARDDFAREGVKFRVNLGAKDNADPRWLLPLICRRGGVASKDVGAIRVGPQETVFEISGDAASDFALSAAETDPRAPHVRFEPMRGDARPPGGNVSRPFDERPRSNSPRPMAPRPERPRATPAPAIPAPATAAPANAATMNAATMNAATMNAATMNAATAAAPSAAPKGSRPERTSPKAAASIPSTAGQETAASDPRSTPPKSRAAVTPKTTTPGTPVSPSPASIFQTRTPEPAPLPSAAPASPRPSAKMNAPHVKAEEYPARGSGPLIEMKRAPRMGGAAPAPRSHGDGNSPPKRSSNAPRGAQTDTPQPRPFAPRGSGTDRPQRPTTGGRGPGFGARPPERQRSNDSARPSSASPRPPFWKEGARKRPGAPSPHGAGAGGAPKSKQKPAR